jgi:hypothetical protein
MKYLISNYIILLKSCLLNFVKKVENDIRSYYVFGWLTLYLSCFFNFYKTIMEDKQIGRGGVLILGCHVRCSIGLNSLNQTLMSNDSSFPLVEGFMNLNVSR